MSAQAWPSVELDAITRLRAIATAYPNAGIGEVVVDAPFERVWSWITDFENTTPRFDDAIKKVRIVRRTPGGLRMHSWVRGSPVPLPFDVAIEPGFCLMRGQARAFLVLMAAVPEGDGRTRYAHAEAIPLPGLGALRPLLQRAVNSDLANLAKHLGT